MKKITSHPLYPIWQSMKQRCLNKNHPAYYRYGGRGISVCDRWINSFINFISDMGDRPNGFTIERKDNNGNYDPENCKWASRIEQAANRAHKYSYFTEEEKEIRKAIWLKSNQEMNARRKSPPKICIFCGIEFTHRQGSTKNPPKFCSEHCYHKSRILPKIDKTCPWCLTIFSPRRRNKGQYCSIRCGSLFRAKMKSS